MITPEYCQAMARYNAWQNRSLIAAADTLSDDQRRLDRGAFFGSIFRTLNHVAWADAMWMHRLAGDPPAAISVLAQTPEHMPDWRSYKDERARLDARIGEWAAAVTADELATDLRYFTAVVEREVVRPYALIATHLFNHATHHRGQVHAMLTAAGARPEATDLPFSPWERERDALG